MPLLRWTVGGALVAVLGTSASAQLSNSLSIDAPYEVVPDHFKPNFPEGWTFGGIGGIYVESPDRVYVYQYGILPVLAQFVGADGKPARDAVRREGERREYILTVYDRSGKRIEHWKEVDALHQGKSLPHRVRVSPWDPEKHVWLIDEGQMGDEGQMLKVTRTGKLALRVGAETGCFRPQDIAFTPNGDFWCVEGFEHGRIVKYSKDGKRLMDFGRPGSGPGEFKSAHAITIDRRGRMYIADRGNLRIQVFDENARFLESWPEINAFTFGIDKNNRLWTMCGTDMCGANGTPHGMTAFNMSTSKALFTFGSAGGRPGQLWWPSQFDVDPEGNLYVIESRGGRVQMFRPKKGANPSHLIAWPLDRPN